MFTITGDKIETSEVGIVDKESGHYLCRLHSLLLVLEKDCKRYLELFGKDGSTIELANSIILSLSLLKKEKDISKIEREIPIKLGLFFNILK